MNLKNNKWSCDEICYLKNNYKNMFYEDIAKVLNRTKSAVQNKLNKMGLSKQQPFLKRIFNKRFFENIDTEDKAYWLGFISADGCIYTCQRGYKGLKITLKRTDEKHLEKFIKSIDGNFSIKRKINKCNGKTFETCEVNFKSLDMVNDLEQYITPNKTNNLIMPKLRKDLIRHYLRGFSDGDGSFYCGNKSNRKSYEIISNSPKMIYKIQEIFKINNIDSNVYRKQNGNYKLGIYNFKNLKKLHDYFYSNCNIYMERKFKKSQDISNLAS